MSVSIQARPWIATGKRISAGSAVVTFSNTAGSVDVNTGMGRLSEAFVLVDYDYSQLAVRKVNITVQRNTPSNGSIRIWGKNFTDDTVMQLMTYWLAIEEGVV